jgi:hypothetical protein
MATLTFPGCEKRTAGMNKINKQKQDLILVFSEMIKGYKIQIT